MIMFMPISYCQKMRKFQTKALSLINCTQPSNSSRADADVVLQLPVGLRVALARHKVDGETILDGKHAVVVDVI